MKRHSHGYHGQKVELDQLKLYLDDYVMTALFICGVTSIVVWFVLTEIPPPCGGYAFVLGMVLGIVTVRYGPLGMFQIHYWLQSLSTTEPRRKSALDIAAEQVIRQRRSTLLIALAGTCLAVVGYIVGGGLLYDWQVAQTTIRQFGWSDTILGPALVCLVFSAWLLFGLNLVYVKWQLGDHPREED